MILADCRSVVEIRTGARCGMHGKDGGTLQIPKRTDPKGQATRTSHALALHGRAGILSGW